MSQIAENIQSIRRRMEQAALDAGVDAGRVQLCAATKMNDAEAVKQAVMGGVDAVVFTAGIGENNAELREMAVEKLEFIGIKVDPVRNRKKADAMDISADDASVKTLVIATNEELMIARDTLALTNPR